MKIQRALPAVLFALFAFSSGAPAAGQEDPGTWPWFAPGQTLRDFQTQSDAEWQVRWDEGRGAPQLIFGGRLPLSVDTTQDDQVDALARAMVDCFAGALGLHSDELELLEVKRLPLSRVGSSDKVAALYRQVVAGVPVQGGGLSVLFSAEGEFLALDSNGLPHAGLAPTSPDSSLEEAVDFAARAFERETGRAAASQGALEQALVLYPAPTADDRVRAELAWRVVVQGATAPEELPLARGYAIAARGALRVLASWSTVHEALPQNVKLPGASPTDGIPVDPHGFVYGWGDPGLKPFGHDALELYPLYDVGVGLTLCSYPYCTPDVFSDPLGLFLLPAPAPVGLVAVLSGQYYYVLDYASPPPDFTSLSQQVAPGVGPVFTFNAGQDELGAAGVNVQRSILAFRDWVLEVDPSCTVFDFQVASVVNPYGPCVAVFTTNPAGHSIRFARSGVDPFYGYCPNMAYSSVVWHEQGHWANVLFGSGNGPDGFGEGAADAWSMYVADDPVIARNVFDGQHGRLGWNLRPFCGDDAPGCYGQTHLDGEVLMGALWKVRARLKAELGPEPGAQVADALFLSWFQVFDDSEIRTLVRDHWLVLDDDDGDLTNGTPHSQAIECGFGAQGFPTGTYEEAQLVSSQAPWSEYYGRALDMDAERLVVGVESMSSGSLARVAVYRREQASWIEEQLLLASDPVWDSGYGTRVAVDGDTIAVAAHEANFGEGAVYVYTYDGSTWVEEAKLVAPGSAELGVSVAVHGDVLAAGALEDPQSTGAVYVFRRSGTSWSAPARLEVDGLAAGELFGRSVALADDRLAVGVGAKTPDYVNGSAYVFRWEDSVWIEEQQLLGEPGVSRLFGQSLAFTTAAGEALVVGCPRDFYLSGSFWVFERQGTSWTDVARVIGPNEAMYDHFGHDVDADAGRIVVGAHGEGDPAHGAAYLYRGAGASWTLENELVPSDTLQGTDNFGKSVAVEGELVAVGAPGRDEATGIRGKVYLFAAAAPCEAYGTGLVGHDQMAPVIWACGDPVPGGTLRYHVHGGVPHGTGLLHVGSGRTAVPFQGGTLLVDDVTSWIPLSLDEQGTATYLEVYPDDPLFIGTQINLQWWGDDPDGPAGYASSNGLEVVVRAGEPAP